MMDAENLIQMRYVDTYRIAHEIDYLLESPFDHLRAFESFSAPAKESGLLTKPFPKESIYHAFIFDVTHSFFFESLDCKRALKEARWRVEHQEMLGEDPKPGFWLTDALEAHGIDHGGLFGDPSDDAITLETATEDDIYQFYEELLLAGWIEELELQITDEVFQITFHNRGLLLKFNALMSLFLSHTPVESRYRQTPVDDRFRKTGVLERTYMPQWVKKAVYHRDKGRCCLCRTDLTGLLSLEGEKHFDHIVPLAQGGINDVSNVQLLCKKCNLEKGGDDVSTSFYYEKWY